MAVSCVICALGELLLELQEPSATPRLLLHPGRMQWQVPGGFPTRHLWTLGVPNVARRYEFGGRWPWGMPFSPYSADVRLICQSVLLRQVLSDLCA